METMLHTVLVLVRVVLELELSLLAHRKWKMLLRARLHLRVKHIRLFMTPIMDMKRR